MLDKTKLTQVELGKIYGKWEVIECIEPFRPEDNYKGVWKVRDIYNSNIKQLNGQYLITIGKHLSEGYYDKKENEENFEEDVDNTNIFKFAVYGEDNELIGNLCRICHKVKPLQKFRSNEGTVCLDCVPYLPTSYNDPVNVRRKKLSKKDKRVRQQYSSTKTSDEKHKRENNLTLQDVYDLTSKPCFYCGGYNHQGLRGEGKELDYCGIDRIDNAIGHTKENCVPCCNRCNFTKGNLTVDQWLEHIEKIYKRKEEILTGLQEKNNN